MKLFEDDDVTAEDISNIEIDQEFARRYAHNKKREDLQRYEELKKSGRIDDDDSESESESSDDEAADIAGANKKKDIKFFENLLKVRKQDPSLYQNVPIFSDSEGEEEEGEDEEKGRDDGKVDEKQKDESKKKRKSMYLKDVVAKNLIEDGPEFDDVETREGKRGKTYNEEQEELRNQFLDAVKDAVGEDDGEGGGEFLKLKDKGNEGIGEDDEVLEAKLGEYFGPQEELDENKMFLMEFFKNKMWAEKGNNGRENGFELDDIDDIDGEEVERQEEFEGKFNFRHEENKGDRVMGHSRFVEGAIRKEENPRKGQRKRKEERMKEAEIRREEELKHLKNLKKKEMEERLQKVMEVAGIKSGNGALDLDELEDDFDPQKYDKMMKKAFDDGYYEAEDADPGFGSAGDDDSDIEKPDFDKEDELLGLPKGWNTADDEDGFASTREKILKEKGESDDDDVDDDEQEERKEEGKKDEREDGGKRKKQKRKLSLLQKTKQELLDEYYKLDYEGTIGDLKTRFKYAKVNPNKYGLKTEDILLLEDQDLNQYVSVKKLAPYRESEWKVPSNQKNQYKMKVKELKNNLNIRKASKKNHSPKVDSNNSEGSTSAGLSRKAKRRQNQAHLKLSHGRLLAYGKVQPSAKSKKKV
ncbi:unnamed protein product [Linum trigynum]|uniref:Kri1-like C-terminal domain-containing protein n=1 Tax=Linum trigynum TaxID=586398 RepID=A0AAV2GV02_9ROSI